MKGRGKKKPEAWHILGWWTWKRVAVVSAAGALVLGLLLGGLLWRVWTLEARALSEPPRTAYLRLGEDRQFAIGWQAPLPRGAQFQSEVAVLEVDAAGRFSRLGSEGTSRGPEISPDRLVLKPGAGGPDGFVVIAPDGQVQLSGWAPGKVVELRARRLSILSYWTRERLGAPQRVAPRPLQPRRRT